MPQHAVAATTRIPAPAQQVYAIIADYHDGHSHILPKPPFVSMAVEQGGVGAGTVVTFQMRLLGRLQSFRAHISEPEPGRVLIEANESGEVTTFIVEPQDNGQATLVTITTTTTVRDGLLGKIEGWLTTRLLYPIYVKELAQLAAFAAR
ncbi:MAG: SRPBCC family protein [Chloroflexales bacterium]|nr:SRPBCC family protein [Chloroflexales bacterium]